MMLMHGKDATHGNAALRALPHALAPAARDELLGLLLAPEAQKRRALSALLAGGAARARPRARRVVLRVVLHVCSRPWVVSGGKV